MLHRSVSSRFLQSQFLCLVILAMSSMNTINRPGEFTHGPSPLYKSLPARPPSSTDYEQYRQKAQAMQTTTEIETEKQHVPRSRQRYWMSIATWWQEATAMVLLIASTVASFATLYPYQGKPLPEWPYAITIGALLSAYSVVLRLAATFLLSEGLAQTKWRWFKTSKPLYDIVLHDYASRGPIGAFGLLWRLPFPVTWQWMGCVLAIIALLIGPFTQQVLQYEECAVPVAVSNAVIARSSVFMGQGVGDRRDPSAAFITLSMAEQSAVNTGIYTPGSGSFTCDSGNCTFASYSSVGYCSSCEDVSSSVRFTKVNDTLTSSIPSLINIPSMDYVPTKQVSAHGSAPVRQNYATGIHNYIEHDIFTVLIGLQGTPTDPSTGLAPTGCDNEATNQTWRCQGYAAASCAAFPCIRTYSANVTNGVLHEQVINTDRTALRSSSGTWFDRYSAAWGALELSCLTDQERDTLRGRNYTWAADASWLPYNITSAADMKQRMGYDIGKASTTLEQGFVDRGCLYAVDGEFDDSLQSFIGAFGGDLSGMVGDATKILRSLNGSQVLQTIFNYGDYSLEHTNSLFDNITTSLSNYMRKNPGATDMVRTIFPYNYDPSPNGNSSSISLEAGTLMRSMTGQEWTTRTCVRVQWPWLALPAALALLTLVFFVGVTISCGGLPRDVRTWKTSPLPLIFYPPGGKATGDAHDSHWSKADSQHVDDMNSAAKSVNVTLHCDRSTGFARFDQVCTTISRT